MKRRAALTTKIIVVTFCFRTQTFRLSFPKNTSSSTMARNEITRQITLQNFTYLNSIMKQQKAIRRMFQSEDKLA